MTTEMEKDNARLKALCEKYQECYTGLEAKVEYLEFMLKHRQAEYYRPYYDLLGEYNRLRKIYFKKNVEFNRMKNKNL